MKKLFNCGVLVKKILKHILKKRADKDYLKDEKQKAQKINKIVGLLLI